MNIFLTWHVFLSLSADDFVSRQVSSPGSSFPRLPLSTQYGRGSASSALFYPAFHSDEFSICQFLGETGLISPAPTCVALWDGDSGGPMAHTDPFNL